MSSARWGAALALVLVSCGPAPRPAVRTLDLDGAWQMRAASDSAWLPATVPGTVHTDLLAAGRTPDPLTGDHEAELAWIEDEDWIYRRDFDVDPDILDHDEVALVFEGLDTYAHVTLNGSAILDTDNQFRTWRAQVRDLLKPGVNHLEVRFDSPVRVGAQLAAASPWPIPHQEPDASAARAFTRKAAYDYGWDWGPRYVTSGIWKPVRLEATSGARIADVWVGHTIWWPDSARVEVNVALSSPDRTTPVRVGVRSPDDAFAPIVADIPPARGNDPTWRFTTFVIIHHPQAWWPRGMGEEPGHLYDIAVDVVQGRRWDRLTRRVGLRRIELVTEPDSVGESFRFEVNDRPVFARGANLVPPDHFVPRADSATYARILDDAVAANMNMLRVWGGGVYLPDVFYDLADERGVMVWQDFMFANTLVPGDSAFVATSAEEAAEQVRRLRHHASLALWCGNNEIAEGWANWGWRDEYTPDMAEKVDAAYRHLFEEVLPGEVALNDSLTDYIPSSPRIGWGHPESLTEGDSHYWGVWWGMEPFRVYAQKVPRFASEFGFQALPDPVTLAGFGGDGAGAAPAGPSSLDDPLLRAHEKHATGLETIRTYLERDWPVPSDDSLDAWSYVSQLAQARGVGLALEAHRRSWPRTAGTLFWQLNDTWPVVSWSSVDVHGRWKALQYESRRIFAPVAVLADRWADTLGVWVAADTAVSGTLRLRVLDLDGHEVAAREVAVDGAGAAWRGTRSELLPQGIDPRSVVVVASLETPDGAVVSDHAFFVSPRDLTLPEPEVEVVSAEADGDAWNVTLTARRFAFATRISVEGVGTRASANYVDLLPGEPMTVRLIPESPTPDLPGRLRLRTLADTPAGGR